MPTALEKFQHLKNEVSTKRQEKARAEGVRDEKLKMLKASFATETLEQAEKKLKEEMKIQEQIECDFAEKVEEFEKKWGTQLAK